MRKNISVFISFDLEGVAGVTSWREMKKDSVDLLRTRRLATAEVNAVVRGIRRSDRIIDEILICDSHAAGENLLLDDLEKGVYLIKGTQRNYYMMEGINRNFDLAFMVGYHAMAGTENGTMDHSYSSSSIYRLRINGREVGETAINAAIAGFHGVPVGLVSGDDALVREARKFLGREVETVTTKYAISRYAAKCRHPRDVCRELELTAERAVCKARTLKPFRFRLPIKSGFEVLNSQIGDVIKKIPGLARLDGRTFSAEHRDVLEFYRMLMVICDLAAYANASAG